MILLKKKEKPTQAQWLWEFSKRLVIACSIIYFMIQVYAAVCMVTSENYDSLPTLIEQSSLIMSDCVFGYFVKAAAENVVKIISGKNENTPSSDWDEAEG